MRYVTYFPVNPSLSVEIGDMSGAFFETAAIRNICFGLPEEEMAEGDKEQDLVEHLQMSLYGTLVAATNWQKEVARRMIGHGCQEREV